MTRPRDPAALSSRKTHWSFLLTLIACGRWCTSCLARRFPSTRLASRAANERFARCPDEGPNRQQVQGNPPLPAPLPAAAAAARPPTHRCQQQRVASNCRISEPHYSPLLTGTTNINTASNRVSGYWVSGFVSTSLPPSQRSLARESLPGALPGAEYLQQRDRESESALLGCLWMNG